MNKKVSIEKLMQEVVFINNQLKGLQALLSSKKSTLAIYFDKTGNRRVENEECTAYVQEKPTITYDIQAIEDKFPKELCAQFIDINRIIPQSSWKSFVSLLKKHGITAQQIKPFVFVEKSVNQKDLSALYEQGVVTLKNFSGCYSAEVKKSVVLRMKNIENEINITRAIKENN